MFTSFHYLKKETIKEGFIFEASFFGIVHFIKKSDKNSKLTMVTFIDETGEKLKCNIFEDKDLEWKINDIIFCEKIKVIIFYNNVAKTSINF
jgi:hypothetical protein